MPAQSVLLVNNARAGYEAEGACPLALPSPEGLAWLAGRWCADNDRPLPKSVKVTGKRIALAWPDGTSDTLVWDSLRRRVARA